MEPLQNQNESASVMQDAPTDVSNQHNIDTVGDNIIRVRVTDDPQFDSFYNELLLKNNRKQKDSSTPAKSYGKTSTESISQNCCTPIKQRLRQPKRPAVDQSKPTGKKSYKRKKTSEKSRNLGLNYIDCQPKKAHEAHCNIPNKVSELFVNTNNGMQTVQSQLLNPSRSTSTGNFFLVDRTCGESYQLSWQPVVLLNDLNANQQSAEPSSFINLDEHNINMRPILQSCASVAKDDVTEFVKNEYIETPRASSALSYSNMTVLQFPGSSLNRVLDFEDELPGKTEADCLQQFDTARETPSNTFDINPKPTLPNLN